jgi:hypothetical protein
VQLNQQGENFTDYNHTDSLEFTSHTFGALNFFGIVLGQKVIHMKG